MEHTKEPVVDLRAICIADENAFMKTLADRVVGNANPEEDSRLDVAYAIARHLKLDWPSAYEAPITTPASEQKPFAWFAKNDITDLLEIEWTTSKPIYEGIWEPLFRKPYESFCHEERPCIPCFTDNGPCADAPDYKAQRDKLLALVVEARATFEMWKDVAPAVSLCEDLDKVIASVKEAKP